MTLGEKIRMNRESWHWTLKDLAHHSGLSVGYLSDIERGRTLPSVPTLVKLADAFNMTVIVLIVGVDFGEQYNQIMRFLSPE